MSARSFELVPVSASLEEVRWVAVVRVSQHDQSGLGDPQEGFPLGHEDLRVAVYERG
jgi:hypothetical protein